MSSDDQNPEKGRVAPDIERQRNRIDGLKQMVVARDEKISALKDRLERLQGKHESARALVVARDEKIRSLRRRLESSTEELRALKASVGQVDDQNKSLRKMVAARDDKNARLRQQLDRSAQMVERLSTEIKRIKTRAGESDPAGAHKRHRAMALSGTQIVICGTPRSGATLLYNMIRASSERLIMPLHETSAGKLMASKGDVVTMRPKDVFAVEQILELNVRHKAVRLILVVRDPRSVLVARDPAYPHQPCIGHDHGLFVSPEVLSNTDTGLIDYIDAVLRHQNRATPPAPLTVRFEDLVRHPAAERARLAEHTGCPLDEGFERFYETPMPDGFPSPLKGPRPLDQSGLAPWRTGPGAARVVRQFRLAPRLFEALEAWGYETDRRWYDELAEVAPEGLDDRPGLAVGFYTDDEIYRREAERLEISARRLGLPLELLCIPKTDDWLAAVRFKVEFLTDMRRRRRGRLLYVDVDAVFHSDPWPHLNGYDADVAFSVPMNGRARSGTVLLADSPGAMRFLEEWAARLKAAPEAWDQHPLSDIVREHRDLERPPYNVQFLTPELCYVFDSGVEGVPIIEHLQASREGRTESETALERLDRRRKRVEEVDQLFFD